MLKSLPVTLPIGPAFGFVGFTESNTQIPESCDHAQIITHTDLDGYSSAAVAVLALRDMGYPDDKIDIGHYDYSVTPHINDNCNMVIITDYSITDVEFAAEIVRAMKSNVTVFWFDHHASSLSWLEDHPGFFELKSAPGVRNTNYCGAYLIWSLMYSNTPIPDVIKYIDDFDCWKKTMWQSDALNAAFNYFRDPRWDKNPKSKSWEILFSETADSNNLNSIANAKSLRLDMLDYGEKFLAYFKDYQYYQAHKTAFLAKLTKFPEVEAVVLTGLDVGSQSFADLLKNRDNPDGKYPVALSVRNKGAFFECSVYTADDASPNAREICEKYGGGGHPGAAGFIVKMGEELPYKIDTIQKLPKED